ncbi:hypothetical protein Tco_0431163 [Tanacetum coccineum]
MQPLPLGSMEHTRDSGEGSFNLNSTAGDKEDKAHEVRPTRPMGRDQAKRKGKEATLSASSATIVDVETLARLTVNEYFSFGGHLEELHVTWAHLEKKRTRLQTYTNIAQEFLYSGWRRRHRYNVTPSPRRSRRRHEIP